MGTTPFLLLCSWINTCAYTHLLLLNGAMSNGTVSAQQAEHLLCYGILETNPERKQLGYCIKMLSVGWIFYHLYLVRK